MEEWNNGMVENPNSYWDWDSKRHYKCRLAGRCSAPEQEMELLMFLDQVEIKFAATNFVELQIQWCCKQSARLRRELSRTLAGRLAGVIMMARLQLKSLFKYTPQPSPARSSALAKASRDGRKIKNLNSNLVFPQKLFRF